MAEFGVKYWAELRSRYKGVLWRSIARSVR